MTEILTIAMIFAACAMGAMSQYKRVNDIEDRISRLERKTVWKA